MVRYKVGRPSGELGGEQVRGLRHFSLQCFNTVGWATGRASGLLKAGCWFVGGDDLTGALHVL